MGAFFGESIESRSLKPFGSFRVKAYQVVAMIIAQDEDDVGRSGYKQTREKEKEEETKHAQSKPACFAWSKTEMAQKCREASSSRFAETAECHLLV